MDYEKKYNEALERAKELIAKWTGKNKDFYTEDYSYIFPELAESEDERIRKWIVNLLHVLHYNQTAQPMALKAIEYLEKQKEPEWNKKPCLTCKEYENGFKAGRVEGCTAGYNKAMKEMEQEEQKPAEWSEEDEHRRKDAIYFLETAKSHYADTSELDSTIAWLKSLRPQPKQEWSEEDEKTINLMIAILRENHPDGLFKTNPVNTTCMSAISTDMLIKRIESLRPSWKPSEEQMEALRRAVHKLAKSDVADSVRLSIMFDNLKKYSDGKN